MATRTSLKVLRARLVKVSATDAIREVISGDTRLSLGRKATFFSKILV